MSFKKIVVLGVFISFLYSCNPVNLQTETPKIIPIPLSQTLSKGYFSLDETTGISFEAPFDVSANFLKNYIKQGSGLKLEGKNSILFINDKTLENDEGYTLEILQHQIKIKAKTDQGAFYAVQTLRQLLPVGFENHSLSKHEIRIPCMTIIDRPQFKYRGMHLDVSRHLFSVDVIKQYIDAIAMLKMNTFHWHLTDDQGWRIEIKTYPKLQEIAAFRNQTLIGHYSDQPQQFDGKRYGGYYTQEEVKTIVAYAESRHVTIIPEIEMPGHAQAAISAYPYLGCSEKPIEVAEKWGVFEDIYCTKDETFNFLENVLDEVISLFPSKYIHIGGDEAPKTNWKSCLTCQNKIQTEGLKDAHELQNYFITRIEKYLNSKGKQIIGWDEILEGGLAPNATVMSWRGTDGAIEAAKQHHNVIMTPTSHCYFDYYQSTNEGEPLAIGGFLPLEKVYDFNPIPLELTKDESIYILGAQGNIWTEYITNEDQLEYMAFPRMLAMSEVVWSAPIHKNYSGFIKRVEYFNKRLDILDINYANHFYEVEGALISKNDSTFYKLTTLLNDKTIRYTLDGNAPKLSSKIYKNPIPITNSATIRAAVFDTKQQLGKDFSETIVYHKAVGKKIVINKTPHQSYSGSGAEGLINGISGSDTRYGDKEWLGFWGEDIEITIDMGEETYIDSIETRFHNGNGQWIYAPKGMSIILDDNTFEYTYSNPTSLILNVEYKITSRTRYVKLKIPNYGIIPRGRQGAGQKAWTFIDEIIIR